MRPESGVQKKRYIGGGEGKGEVAAYLKCCPKVAVPSDPRPCRRDEGWEMNMENQP